jgi:hypothetical protein
MPISAVTGSRRTLSMTAVAALLCLSAGGALAEEAKAPMYECNQGGQVTFSEEPCAGQERKIDVQYDEPSGNDAAAAQEAAQAEENAAGAVAQAAVLDAQILEKQQEIAQLRVERAARVAELRQRRFEGTEQLDQNAWQAQMTQQIASVYEDYSARIVNASADLSALQSQRAALGAPGPASP